MAKAPLVLEGKVEIYIRYEKICRVQVRNLYCDEYCCLCAGCAGGFPHVYSASKGQARANATPALTSLWFVVQAMEPGLTPTTTIKFTGWLQTHQSTSMDHREGNAERWLLHPALGSELLLHSVSCSDDAPACVGLGRTPPWVGTWDPKEPHCRCHPHLQACAGCLVVFWPFNAITDMEEKTLAFKAAAVAIESLATA